MVWLYGCWVWSSVDDFTQAMAAAKSKSALHVSVGYRSFEACRRFHRRRLWSAWAVHDVFCYWTNWEESQTIEVRQQQVLNWYWTPDFFYEPGAPSPASCYRYWTGTERLISSMNLVPTHSHLGTGTVVAERLHNALCLSVARFNSTICRAQCSIISYFSFWLTTAYS